MSHSLRGEVGLEPGPDAAGVAVWPGHLAPDRAQLGLLAPRPAGDGRPLLSPVHIHTLLACVEDRIFLVACTFNLEKLGYD